MVLKVIYNSTRNWTILIRGFLWLLETSIVYWQLPMENVSHKKTPKFQTSLSMEYSFMKTASGDNHIIGGNFCKAIEDIHWICIDRSNKKTYIVLCILQVK